MVPKYLTLSYIPPNNLAIYLLWMTLRYIVSNVSYKVGQCWYLAIFIETFTPLHFDLLWQMKASHDFSINNIQCARYGSLMLWSNNLPGYFCYYIRSIGYLYSVIFLRFCLTHGMPEVHGCGDAVKIQARINISREGKIYSGECDSACVLRSDLDRHCSDNQWL